VIHSRAVNYR